MNARSTALPAGLAIAGLAAFTLLRKRRSDPHDTFTMTVLGTPDQIRARWESDERTRGDEASFRAAPGQRGTEITIPAAPKRREHLRAFKQIVEAGTLTIAVARP